jgi:cleavage and polyadenylation specificity factor subunit 1
LSAIGQKVYIWQLKESSLVGVAFIDTQIYIHSAVSIKNLVLVADVHKSISLLRYQEETRTLALVSRDTRSFEVYGCEFLIHGNQLCFMVSDADKNIIVYNYQPELRESSGGTRLIRRADFYLGSHVNHFFRIRCKLMGDLRQKPPSDCRQVTMYATLDGSLGFVLPVSEKIYRRLLMLQNIMTTQIQHLAGLNPKAFRLFKAGARSLMNPCRNVLDGDLLWKFLTLSMTERAELSKKIGTTTDQILEDLHQIDRVSAHF